MPLFNHRVLDRASAAIGAIAPDHAPIVAHWAGMVRSGRIRSHKETALDGDFKTGLVESVLGYRAAGHADGQTVDKEHAVGGGRVDLALGRFNGTDEVVAPFELKGADTRDLDAPMPGRNISPVEQAWAYARAVGRSAEWVLVTNYEEIRLYSYRDGDRQFERFKVGRLDELPEYRRFVTLLSADNLLGGRTGGLLRASLDADRAIGADFYAEYQGQRERLIAEIAADPAGHAPDHVIALAQTIMDRVLFVAFAEDRGLLPDHLLAHAADARDAFAPRPAWENFKALFRLIDGGGEIAVGGRTRRINAYNGGLFRRSPEIQSLTISDTACAGFKAIGAYDFADDVDVTILGHIFEQSLRDLEAHLALARGEAAGDFRSLGKSTDRRKQDGIYYTPQFVARFITERTLGAAVADLFAATMADHAAGDPADYDALRFEGQAVSAKRRGTKSVRAELTAWYDYRERLQRLRVVDPACGSGIFLVTAFDALKREYDRTNAKIVELRGDAGTIDIFDIDAAILSGNLYGVDVNAESVEITKLSLWLKTAKRDRPLDALEHTIRVGDSLIEDSSYAYLHHGFTWEGAFPEVFDPEEGEGGFDVVLGNPPYVRMELIKAMKPYLERRYEVVSDRADLYCYFYERGLRVLRPGGRLGFISNNTFMKTGSGRPLRDYLRANAAIDTVVDFGDVQIFEGVTTYPVIMVMRAGAPAETHELQFWDVPAVPADEFGAAFDAAAQAYPQASLGSGSWELEGEALRALREKIVGGHPTLAEVYGAPLYGIKTGLNAAFVIDAATRDRLVAADPASADLLRPWLEGKDLRRWRAEPRDLSIIYIPKNRVRIEDYPAIRDHLAPFREWEETTRGGRTVVKGLEHRATQQEWFELQQAQANYEARMSEPKIVYSRFLKQSEFAYDPDGYSINNALWAIPTQDLELLAYLNSSALWFLLVAESTDMSGGFSQADAADIQDLPIPFTDAPAERSQLADLARTCQRAAAERLDLQRAVSRRIPDLAPPEAREPDGSLKLGRKLEAWWQLDFPAFRAEIKRRFKADIPLAERTEWETWLDDTRRAIDQHSATIARRARHRPHRPRPVRADGGGDRVAGSQCVSLEGGKP